MLEEEPATLTAGRPQLAFTGTLSLCVSEMLVNLWLVCVCLCFSWTEARIWAWMLNMPHSPPKEGAKGLREDGAPPRALTAVCDHDRACGRGFSCDRHFGLCVPLRGEGQYCRRDAQCVRGLSCMFGKCHRSVPTGQEGSRCKVDRDCGPSMCCARHHGEQVCKRRLVRGESCYVPDGGLAFSINQICPCDEGLLCREASGPQRRQRDFIYQPERSWTCQAPKH